MRKKYFQAFALELSNGPEAPPTLSARGEYDLANHIVACARKYGIPIVERPDICQALEDVEIDSEIPVELFEAAAAILAEVGALSMKEPDIKRQSELMVNTNAKTQTSPLKRIAT